MNKKLLPTLIISTLITSSLYASVYKGHYLFKKKCLSCHGKALVFVTGKTTSEWEDLMFNSGDGVANLHFRIPNTEENFEYFKGKRYKKHSRHFLDFFLEYSADSGNIPACD